jgi:hypothetical protein
LPGAVAGASLPIGKSAICRDAKRQRVASGQAFDGRGCGARLVLTSAFQRRIRLTDADLTYDGERDRDWQHDRRQDEQQLGRGWKPRVSLREAHERAPPVAVRLAEFAEQIEKVFRHRLAKRVVIDGA